MADLIPLLPRSASYSDKIMEKEKSFGLSAFVLKIIACLLMTLDHIALLFIPGEKDTYTLYYVFRAIGKLSFPIFVFLATEGAYRTKNIYKYLLRLGVFGLIMDGFGFLFGNIYNIAPINNPMIGNAFSDMFLGVLAIYLLKRKDWFSFLAVLPIVVAVLSDIEISPSYGSLFKTDWGTFSIVLFLSFYTAKEVASLVIKKKNTENPTMNYEVFSLKYNKLFEIIALITVELVFYLLWKINYTLPIIPNEFVPIGSYSVIASIILAFYNGNKGYQSKKIQYAFYCYYPLHILILGILSLFFGVLSSWRGIL